MAQSPLLLEVKNLQKSFPGVHALKGVNFSLAPGSIHAIVGENGAGKSTLIKIMSGVYAPDEGEIFLDGEPVKIDNPREAHQYGIFTVHQELSLAPNMSVAENVFLGMPIPKKLGGFVRWNELHRQTREIMEKLGLEIDPRLRVGSLKVGEQQLVEIAKGFVTEPKILILDEPTSALSMHEIRYLFKTLKNIRDAGFGVIYISHRMEEIFEIADTATILREGEEITTTEVSSLDTDSIARMMTGKETTLVDRDNFRQGVERGTEVLRVENLQSRGVNDVSFSVYRNEILGVAGLMGAGRTELAKTIYGAQAKEAGSVFLEGTEVEVKDPEHAIALGIGYTTEDRKNEGLLLEQSVKFNLTLSILRDIATYGWLGRQEVTTAKEIVESYNVVTPSISQHIKYLSGGNQQKVVIARALASRLKVIILDEPTKGVDIGAKQEVFSLVNRLAQQGLAVIFISSELSEVVDVADRILMLSNGRVVSTLERKEASKQRVIETLITETNQ